MLHFGFIFIFYWSAINKYLIKMLHSLVGVKFTSKIISIHVFFIRKPFFCLSLNFLNIMLEIRLRFP